MKRFYNFLTILFALAFCVTNLKAQEKISFDKKTIMNNTYKLSAQDSLLHEFLNGIYYCFYDPTYMANKTPTFTVLKVDITWDGQVTDIRFSDSADSVFLKAWQKKLKTYNIKATIEKYAIAKHYKYISLLIPVSFEPQQPNSNKYFTNNYLESYLKFNQKIFEGNAIILSPVIINVLAHGEK